MSVFNTAMHKVSDTTTYEMVPAKVKGLLAIIKNQISKLKVHSQAVSATKSEVEMWQQEQQWLMGLVDMELWLLYTTLA